MKMNIEDQYTEEEQYIEGKENTDEQNPTKTEQAFVDLQKKYSQLQSDYRALEKRLEGKIESLERERDGRDDQIFDLKEEINQLYKIIAEIEKDRYKIHK